MYNKEGVELDKNINIKKICNQEKLYSINLEELKYFLTNYEIWTKREYIINAIIKELEEDYIYVKGNRKIVVSGILDNSVEIEKLYGNICECKFRSKKTGKDYTPYSIKLDFIDFKIENRFENKYNQMLNKTCKLFDDKIKAYRRLYVYILEFMYMMQYKHPSSINKIQNLLENNLEMTTQELLNANLGKVSTSSLKRTSLKEDYSNKLWKMEMLKYVLNFDNNIEYKVKLYKEYNATFLYNRDEKFITCDKPVYDTKDVKYMPLSPKIAILFKKGDVLLEGVRFKEISNEDIKKYNILMIKNCEKIFISKIL